MKAFLDWFETKDDGSDPVLRAAIAHLWFVTIHPFDDDYGRTARARPQHELFACREMIDATNSHLSPT